MASIFVPFRFEAVLDRSIHMVTHFILYGFHQQFSILL